MKIEELHKFTQADWKLLETQFAGFSEPVIDFVTENKGSLCEAEDIYIDAFIYYTQLLELHGLKLIPKAQDLIYSFSRKLWLKVLGKRNVDVNFVKHRRSFYEMEDAFEEIESINNRSDKTAQKLAEVGEPARTLILDHIGRKLDLEKVGGRLGYATKEKAFLQIAKSLRRLITLTEGKSFELTNVEFEDLIQYVLDNSETELTDFSEDKQVALTMIARVVAMVRNYITRNERLTKLKDMQERIQPNVHAGLNKKASSDNMPNKSRKMKPVAVFILSAVVALSVSVLTAFGISNMTTQNEIAEPVVAIDTIRVVKEEPIMEPIEKVDYTAFPISNDGLFVTSAKAKKGHVMRIQSADGSETLKGEVVFADTTQGLTLIKCDIEKSLRLPYMLAFEDAKLAQELYAIGYSQQSYFFSEGRASAEAQNGSGKVKIGNVGAGSPIVSNKGQIVGLVVGTESNTGLNPVIYCSKIKEAVALYETSEGKSVKLTQRNGLFYDSKMKQVEKLKPYIYQVINN